MKLSTLNRFVSRVIKTVLALVVVGLFTITESLGDVIMMNGNSMPSIIEDNSDRPDVFVGGSFGNFIINDDLIL